MTIEPGAAVVAIDWFGTSMKWLHCQGSRQTAATPTAAATGSTTWRCCATTAHRALFGGDRHLDYGLAGSLAHERADALRKRLKEGSRYFEADPSTVQIAIELKTVMTEHHKTAKNRKRDLEAHHEHVHKYSAQALAGGVLLTNIAKRFDSPTRKRATLRFTRTRGSTWSTAWIN